MCEKLATLQRRFAAFYRFHKSVFLNEVSRDEVLYDLVWVAAVSSGTFLKPGLDIRGKVNFHAIDDTVKRDRRQSLCLKLLTGAAGQQAPSYFFVKSVVLCRNRYLRCAA